MEERLAFKKREAFREWLLQNHDRCEGLWLVYYKSSETDSIRYDESVEEALCFGWVECLLKRIDDHSYMRKYTPRKPSSVWSEKNKRLAERLMDEGKMEESGLRAVEDAVNSGNWEKNYRLIITPEQIIDFEKMLYPYLKAYEYYSILSPSNKRQYHVYYYQAKREETRINRFKTISEMLENRKGFI
jgi:uncharacterized protein YdeI (YjbR/CyaY-like superfamily)